MKKRGQYKLFLFVSVMALLGMALGALVTHPLAAVAKDRYADLQMFTKVLNLVEQQYVEDVDTKQLIYGGIKGMLATLDPHTNFLPPDLYKSFTDDTAGEFDGIGIEVTLKDDILTVVSPIEDTPAFKAGIKGGDKIVEINGKSTKNITVEEAVDRMRGKRGSPVTIAIYRDGFDTPKKFTLLRQSVHMKSVKFTDFNDGFEYVRIMTFARHTGDELRNALAAELKKDGAIHGIILDLRNNAGGLLDAAIDVSNQFIGDGVIVSMKGRGGSNEEIFTAKKDLVKTDAPMVVLMNEYSASASEIVGGALQDHKRAVIMGTRTFGKGSVQSVIELGDGAALKLTVARYYTPSGRSIQAEGIEPDIHLDPVDNVAFEKAIIHHDVTREADIEGHLLNERVVAQKKKDSKTIQKEVFWKTEKMKDADKEASKKDLDGLAPDQKLLRTDYQIAQAFNYLKSWSLLNRNVPALASVTASAQVTSAAPVKHEKKASKKASKKKSSQ